MSSVRSLYAALTSVLVASCSLFGPAESRLSDLTLTPSDSVAAAPATVRFSGINNSGAELLYGPCDAAVQRLADGVWSYTFGSSDQCGGAARVLYSGDSIVFAIAIVDGISAGTYRARLRLTTTVDDREVLAVSSPFRIQ